MKHTTPRRSDFLCVLLFACSASLASSQTVDPDTLIGTIDARIDQVFRADSGDPYSPRKVEGSLGSDRPYFARDYSWSVVGYAARCFYLNESLSQANARLQQNARYYLRELTAADKAEILPDSAEKNTHTYARTVDRDSLHWHADVVLRLIQMYGTNGTVAPGRMDAATEAKCLEPIWHYVRLVSRLEKADYQNTKTWYLWESENHHAQSFSLAWQFSKIVKDRPEYQNRTYDDGSTPGELYEAWNEYFVEYVRERFRKGIFVEMLSMSYNGESIRGIYNFHDFGNAEVREHARMYLDLYFAYWAQEQFNSVPGGGRSRTTLKNSLSTHKGVAGKLAYIYFNLSNRPSVDGGIVNALLSDYRPPSVVADIATDIVGRGTYEVRQAAQGLGGAARTNWDQSRADLVPYTLNTNGGGIQRYTYCDPAFIMGTPMVEARPASDWTAISSQSRWQGAVFSGGAEEARIVPLVLPTSESHVGNAYWTVQSKGSMITQMLTTHQGGERMWAWISKAGLTDPVEENGIVFVEADGAYAAIRPVGTGYTLIEDYNFSSINPSSHWIVQPNDTFKPLILEVMAKDEVSSFQSFKNLVQANSPVLKSGLLTYTTIYADVLTMDTNYGDPPTINGEPVDYTPPRPMTAPSFTATTTGRFSPSRKEPGGRSTVSLPAVRSLRTSPSSTRQVIWRAPRS